MSPTPYPAGRGRRPFITVAAVIGAGALLGALAACEQDPGPGAADFISSAEAVGQEAQISESSERLGSGSADGPAVSVEGEATVINGGSQLVTLTATEQFSSVRVAIQAIAGAVFTSEEEQPDPGQLPGYYQIELAQPATEVDLVLTLAQQLPTDLFRFDYAAVGPGGAQGPTTSQDASTIAVGSGEVQVSVSWDAASDVDLYVVDPDGTEIYYGSTTSPSGGQLDLDSNAGCEIDNTNNENITWPEAPPGEYTVRVNYWSSCEVEATQYVVTVQVGGQEAQIFNGEFTGEGSRGDAGAGEVVTTFTVTE